MPRNKNGRSLHRNGPETEDLLNALNAIYKDHGVNAELHVYVSLDGRLFVECCADVLIANEPTVHVSEGRFSPNEPYGVMSAMIVTIHAAYHNIDRIEAKRAAAKKGEPKA